jgi:hypothetical protein
MEVCCGRSHRVSVNWDILVRDLLDPDRRTGQNLGLETGCKASGCMREMGLAPLMFVEMRISSMIILHPSCQTTVKPC